LQEEGAITATKTNKHEQPTSKFYCNHQLPRPQKGRTVPRHVWRQPGSKTNQNAVALFFDIGENGLGGGSNPTNNSNLHS
jgi:hypothetical protein